MENSLIIDSDSDDTILSTYSLPTFTKITMSSEEEQQSLLTRSQYAMVVFHGVADTYPTDSDIVCRYSLTDGVEAARGDRVVLFAVGWTSIKDYIVFEWAPIPEKDERDLTVVFKAADLPKDVNEFYQVCYVSNESAVCGASVPFQVRTPHNEELTFALEEDMVVVRSSTAVAQDKLLMAQLEQENLNKKKLNLEKQLHSLEDKHSLTLRRLDRLQETLSTSNALNEELRKENTRMAEISDEMLNIKEQLERALSELENAEKEKKKIKQDFEVERKLIEEQKAWLEIQVAELDYELTEATDKILTLQGEQEEFRNEILVANGKLEENENARASLVSKAFVLENELTVCKFNLNNSQLEILRLKTEIEELTDINKKLEEELKSAKQLEEMHKNLHTEYSTTDRGRLIMNITKLQKTVEEMQIAISTLEHEKLTLEQVLEDTLNAEKNVCSDHCDLEKVVAQLQYRLKEVTSDNEKTKEKKQIFSDDDQSSSSSENQIQSLSELENQVQTLSKLLDDSLKENELRQQENLALRVRNEFLETYVSQDRSKLEEFVIVSKYDNPREDRTTDASQSRIHIAETTNENASIPKRNTNDYAISFAENDAKLYKLEGEMAALKTEFLRVQEEDKIEIDKLLSKNAVLVEQEIQAQELRNEMQKITFMNEELLAQNNSLMKRIHDVKRSSPTSMELNVTQKASNTENIDIKMKIAHEKLSEESESLIERLKLMTEECQKLEQENKYLKIELDALKKVNSFAEKRYSVMIQQYDILNRLKKTELNDKHRHECSVEPKLQQISHNVDHILSAIEKLASRSEVKQDLPSPGNEIDDLKSRLQMAQEEYTKLHTVMTNYRTKYNELKTKYLY